MTTLLLVRHGQSEANLHDLFAGHFDAELMELGTKQAEVTAKYISDHYKIDKVYASDLKRAYKTGSIIAEHLKVELIADQGLREIDGGEWEGLKFWSLTELYPEDFGLWQSDLASARCTGGETVRQLADRIMCTLCRIAEDNPDQTIVVATHATPIRSAMTMVQYGELSAMQNVPWVSNASVTTLTYDEGKWQCVKAGEDAHLKGIITHLSSSAV